jgi:hypothetical protein
MFEWPCVTRSRISCSRSVSYGKVTGTPTAAAARKSRSPAALSLGRTSLHQIRRGARTGRRPSGSCPSAGSLERPRASRKTESSWSNIVNTSTATCGLSWVICLVAATRSRSGMCGSMSTTSGGRTQVDGCRVPRLGLGIRYSTRRDRWRPLSPDTSPLPTTTRPRGRSLGPPCERRSTHDSAEMRVYGAYVPRNA